MTKQLKILVFTLTIFVSYIVNAGELLYTDTGLKDQESNSGATACCKCDSDTIESVNVMDFGAVGDGETDDADAFYNAIMTGKKVVVPAGVYILSQINLPDASTVILCGAGQGVTTLRQKASSINTAMISAYGYSKPKDIDYLEIKNMTIDGNYPNVARRKKGDNNYGTIHVMVREMQIANCEFTQSYHALRVLAVHEKTDGTPGKAVIEDNWFHDMALVGSGPGLNTHCVYVSKNVPAKSTVHILRNNMEACGSGTGENCTLPSTTPGKSVVGILYSPDKPNPPQQKFIIEGNTFRNLGINLPPVEEHTAAVYLYQQSDNSKIIGNHFYRPYYKAICVFSSNNIEIAYNTVEGCGIFVDPDTGWNHVDYYAISVHSRKTNFDHYISSSGYYIHHNTIKNTSCFKYGIVAAFEVNDEVDDNGNLIIPLDDNGNFQGTGTNVIITDNIFSNNTNPYANIPMVAIDTPENAPGAVISGNTLDVSTETLMNKISISPNPSKGVFNFNLPSIYTDNIIITIFTSNGKLIKTIKENNKLEYSIDLSSFASGIYIAKVKSGKLHSNIKIIKE